MQVFIDYLADLNWLAVVLAVLAAFASSAIWYAQGIFGKQWQKEVGLSEKELKKVNYPDTLAYSMLATLVLTIAMALLIRLLVLDTLYQGVLFGIMVAVGIIGSHMFIQVKFEQRTLTYWLIELGAAILSLSIVGAILAVWW